MPTYHYRCKNCGYDFTEQQSFNDDPITVCPKCAQEQVRKVYSAVPIDQCLRRRILMSLRGMPPTLQSRIAHIHNRVSLASCALIGRPCCASSRI